MAIPDEYNLSDLDENSYEEDPLARRQAEQALHEKDRRNALRMGEGLTTSRVPLFLQDDDEREVDRPQRKRTERLGAPPKRTLAGVIDYSEFDVSDDEDDED